MYPLETPNPSPVFGDSFLSSKFFSPEYWFNHGSVWVHDLFTYLTSNNFKVLFSTILFFFSLFFLTVICYCVVRMFEIRRKEQAHLRHEIAEYAHRQAEREKKKQEGENGASKNEKWNTTLTYLFSFNTSDWKLAVIEADSMLDSLLDQLGFRGETLGDKLKMATQETFHGLSSAWEVHTIRNRIAHEGLSFELSQHEAKRIIALYEQIFRQYGYI